MDVKKNWPFEITSLALVFAASMAGWLISGSDKVTAGILAGGLLGIVNFRWLGSIVRGTLLQGKSAGYTLRYLLKFLFVVAASLILLASGFADPLGFVIGFTLVLIMVALRGADLIRS